MPEGQAEVFSSPGPKEEGDSEKRVLVKAILITDDQRSALLVSGSRKTWVHQGERFDGWEIKEIREESVVAWKGGKIFVFFYDRPAITREGES
jgi:type II secretory pathway component PulC